jgi:hypothetical protein
MELFVLQNTLYIVFHVICMLFTYANNLVRWLEPWDVRALSIRKTTDLPLQLWVGTFPCFVAIKFYFLSETLI